MSAPSLPDFERTLQLGQGNLGEDELAESHGLLCGLLCCQQAETAGDFLDHLVAMKLLADTSGALGSVMVEAWETTRRQMDDEDMGFQLWLPDDDEPLEDRTVSLAQWCAGFLAGLGSACSLESLSGPAREALEDLIEISRAELGAEQGGGEEEEAAYAEIVEYVRVVALTLREELRGPGSDDAIH